MANTISSIDYNHSLGGHSLTGPEAALPLLIKRVPASSLLDVGCGRGTWLKAAIRIGINDVFGIDGVPIPEQDLLFPKAHFQHHDLRLPFDLKREFDLILCLEVAEHLSPEEGPQLVLALTKHAPRVLFSAACPGQPGQHHVNCRWPDYWQGLFNQYGFACSDWPRWALWNDARIEPWYRQNMFIAEKQPEIAGDEPRMMPVLHPDYFSDMAAPQSKAAEQRLVARIENANFSGSWYLRTCRRALWRKVIRRLGLT